MPPWEGVGISKHFCSETGMSVPMMTTPATIVNNDFFILMVCLAHLGGPRSYQGAPSGVIGVPPKGVACENYMITTSVCDVSAARQLTPPPWGAGTHGQQWMIRKEYYYGLSSAWVLDWRCYEDGYWESMFGRRRSDAR